MKNKALILLTVLLMCAAVSCASLTPAQKIQIGMDIADVIAILGEPDTSYFLRAGEPKGKRQVLWYENNDIIYLYNGKVYKIRGIHGDK